MITYLENPQRSQQVSSIQLMHRSNLFTLPTIKKYNWKKLIIHDNIQNKNLGYINKALY